MEPVWLTLGTSAVSLLLRFVAFQNEPEAQTLADLTDAGASFVSRVFSGSRRGREAFEEKVAKKLVDRAMAQTELSQALKSDQSEIAGVITEVEAVLEAFDCNRQMLVDIAAKPEDFKRELHSQGAARKNYVSEDAEPLFNALLDVVAAELSERARETKGFEINALISVVNELAVIGEKVDSTHRTLETGLGAIAEQHTMTNERLGNIEEQLERVTPTVQRPERVRYGSRVSLTQNFVERSVVQDLAREIFADRASGVWALKGMRGCGKSQIASYLANRAEGEEWPVVVWQVASSREAMLGMYRALAVQVLPGVQEKDDEVLARMVLGALSSDERWHRQLFVLDNLRTVSDVQDLIPVGNGACVVVTTTRFLPPQAREYRIGVFTQAEAIQFLRAQLPGQSEDSLVELAEAIDYLPVAMEHAAAAFTSLGYREIADFVEVLRGEGPCKALDPDEDALYPQSLCTVFDLSTVALLRDMDEADRLCAAHQLRALCYLSESGVLREFLDVCGSSVPQARKTLGQLIKASLVLETENRGYVSLHRLYATVLRRNPHFTAPSEDAEPEESAIHVIGSIASEIEDGVLELSSMYDKDLFTNYRAKQKEILRQLSDVIIQDHGNNLVSDQRILALVPSILRSSTRLHLSADSCALSPLTERLARGSVERLEADHYVAGAYRSAGRLDEAIGLYEQTLAQREQVLGSTHPTTLASRNNLAHAYVSVGRYDEAIGLFKEALAQCEQVLGSTHPDTLTSHNNLAYAYNKAGRNIDAIPLYEDVLARRERNLGSRNLQTLTTRNNLATAYQAVGRTDEAILLLEHTCAWCVQLLGSTHPQTLACRNNLASAYGAAGRGTDAIPLFEENLADCEKVLGSKHPRTLVSRNNLATAYDAAGRTDDAIHMFEETLGLSVQVLGSKHPHTFASRNNLASAYANAGRVDDAIPLFEDVLSYREQVIGLTHPDTLASRNNLATAYNAVERTDEAISLLEETLAHYVELLGTTHPDTLTSRNNLAGAYGSVGRLDEAIGLHEQTLAQRAQVLGSTHPTTLTSRNNLAYSYASVGRLDEAIGLYEQTLAQCEEVLGPTHPNTLASRNNLAYVYMEAGREDDAQRLLGDVDGDDTKRTSDPQDD